MVATPWDSGYGLMNPWGSAWGMQPQTIADTVVQEQIAPAMGVQMDANGATSRGVPGDPNNKATTSQTTKNRVANSLKGSLSTVAGKTALGIGGALAAGMPADMIGQAALGAIASPGSIGGILGNALNATMGIEPQGFLGRAVSMVPGVVGSVLGGPVGGAFGGLMGGIVSDAVMDGLDARKNEELRDNIEDSKGYFGGRAAVADMQDVMGKVNKVQEAMNRGLASVNAVRGIAGLSPVGYGGTSMSLDTISPRGYGLGGTGSSNTSRGWGGYDAGHASTGFGLSGRAAEIARGALDGINWGGFSVGGRGDSGRGSGGFGSNDGNSDTAGNAGFGR